MTRVPGGVPAPPNAESQPGDPSRLSTIPDQRDPVIVLGQAAALTSLMRTEQLVRLVRSLPVLAYTRWFTTPDQDSPIRFMNHMSRELLGYAASEIESNPSICRTSIHPDDYPMVRQKQAEAARTGHSEYTYRYRHADGAYRHLQAQVVSASALRPKGDNSAVQLIGLEVDVTPKSARQQAIEEERDLLETVLRISSVAVTLLNPAGQIILANEHATEVLGLERSFIESMAYNAPDWGITDWSGQPIPESSLPFAAVMRTKEPVRSFRHAITRQDGQRRLLSVDAEPILDDEGSVRYVVCAVNDLTEQQAAYQALADSESRYRRLIESQLDLVCRYDSRDQITFANQAFCRLFGQDAATLAGQSFQDVTGLPGQYPAQAAVPIGGTRVCEQSLQDHTGSKRHIQWIQRSILNPQGKHIEYLAVGRDITDRRSAERELKRTKDRLSMIIESCPATFFTAELVHPCGLTFVSGRNQDLTGYSPEAFMDPPDRWQRLVHPEDLPSKLKAIEEAIQNGSGRAEFRMLTKGGVYRWCQKEFVVLEDDAGQPTEIVGFILDVHEQKTSEQQLRESREHYRQAARNNRRLLSEVNHRVRNNLSGLLGLLRMAQTTSDENHLLAERLRTRLHAMARLHNLLAGVHWQDVDLRQIMAELLAVPELLHPAARVEPLTGPRVTLSPRIVQPLAMTLTEMLINAAKHGAGSVPGGRIRITWQIQDTPEESQPPQLTLHWTETYGPAIESECTPSMGTDLIHGFVGYELGGGCELTYPREGAQHTLWFPLVPSEQEAE